MKHLYILSIFFSFLLALGCSKDTLEDLGTGTSTLEISASLEQSAQSKSTEITHKFSGNLNFTSGYIWVSEVEFDGTLERGTSINRTVERFSKIDFTTGEALPELNDITIPSGNYSYLNIEVELRDEDAQPAIVMEGTYVRTDGSSSPIRFEFNSGERFEAESEQTIPVDEGTTLLSIIIIDPYTWFDNISIEMLDNANTNANGIILISEGFNEDIYDLAEENLEESTKSEFLN